MAARLSEILSHLDNTLAISNYRDYCPNGLQVEGSAEVSRVVTGGLGDVMRGAPIRVWAATVLAIVLAAGIVISAQLVAHHENRVYGDATASLAIWPGTETVYCDLVNASSWSEIAGVPIAALAIPTYLLLVGLILSAGRSPEVLAYVFGIGVLTVVYSAGLFIVSKTLIGFLCLWCMSLYAVNLSIPVLSAVAARRSPAQLIAAAATDLRQRPRRLRRAAHWQARRRPRPQPHRRPRGDRAPTGWRGRGTNYRRP